MLLVALLSGIFLLSLIIFLVLKLIQLSKNSKVKCHKNKDRRTNRLGRELKNEPLGGPKKQFSCAFFHPNCSAGGGGERVLFAALYALDQKFPNAKFYLFIKSNVKNQNSLAEIKKKAKSDFNLNVPDNLELIPLKTVFLSESKTWPRFTLLGQILGSVILAFEAVIRCKPDVVIDTAGFPFIYPILKLFGCRLMSYVHYPFISHDMITKIQLKSYNNSGLIAGNSFLRSMKIIYYKNLCNIYSFCGRFCDLARTNSSWTNKHILQSWKECSNIKVIYPPCDLTPFSSINLDRKPANSIKILSLSQFRPEKNHRMQLEIAAKVLKERPEAEFLLVGGCRGLEDEIFVDQLKTCAEKLGISKSVKFIINLPFPELIELLQEATIGLHTMTDEHFGIGIVELMSSGLITIAHNSGGPKADIIKKDTGFLCSSVTEYSQTIIKIISMNRAERQNMALKARKNMLEKFSSDIFSKKFTESVIEVLNT